MNIRIKNVLIGRAVCLSDDGSIYFGRNYEILKYDTNGQISLVARVLPGPIRKCIEPFRLLCRLLRHEIRSFILLKDGSKITATRQGLYYSEAEEIFLKPASLPKSKLAVKLPMTVTVDSAEQVLWGEYWGNPDRREVKLFVSVDKGKSYEPILEFKPGEVKHIHNIIEDRYDDCYWVFAGDHGSEPGIGRLSRDFKQFDWLVKGEQRYRAVNGFIFENKIIYGTDTEKDFNGIYSIDKVTGKTENLYQTAGSSIYAARFGRWYVLSTSVEYFEKYENDTATLLVSCDAVNWHQVYEAKKDIWSKKYFQFGSIVLPRGQWSCEQIIFSGQALREIDNKVCIAEIVEQ